MLYAHCIPLIKTPTQSGSRSPWWNGSARTKPASTEPLNISQLREGVITREKSRPIDRLSTGFVQCSYLLHNSNSDTQLQPSSAQQVDCLYHFASSWLQLPPIRIIIGLRRRLHFTLHAMVMLIVRSRIMHRTPIPCPVPLLPQFSQAQCVAS